MISKLNRHNNIIACLRLPFLILHLRYMSFRFNVKLCLVFVLVLYRVQCRLKEEKKNKINNKTK